MTLTHHSYHDNPQQEHQQQRFHHQQHQQQPLQHFPPQCSSDSVDPLLLFQHLKARQWMEAHALLLMSQTPDFGLCRMIATRDEFNNTPLHVAIGYQAPDELILTILALDPVACQIPATDDLWLPLHVAVMWGCSTTVLEALILAYPDGLDHREEKGRTPRYFSTRFPHNRPLLDCSTDEWRRMQIQMMNGTNANKHAIQTEEHAPSSSLSLLGREEWEPSGTLNKRRKVCLEPRI